MNCWEILGINPTDNRSAIDEAYERQRKFASGEELEKLQAAYKEATGIETPAQPERSPVSSGTADDANNDDERSLTAEEHQVVREVCIQIKALLNDSRRASDEGIWKAILCEPPADNLPVRQQIATELEAQIRPLAANGSFPPNVSNFLSDWFGWQELATRAEGMGLDETFSDHPRGSVEGRSSQQEQNEQDDQPQMVDFWPAVIGWIIALAVLGMIFDGLLGG